MNQVPNHGKVVKVRSNQKLIHFFNVSTFDVYPPSIVKGNTILTISEPKYQSLNRGIDLTIENIKVIPFNQ